MSRPGLRHLPILLACVLALAGCDKLAKSPIKLPGAPAAAPPAIDKVKLESAIDGRFGGVGTCVVIADTRSGDEVYRYNNNTACGRLLPPCATFDIANSLIALEAGIVTPTSKLTWDKSPQPVKAWEQDADIRTAFRESILWWQQRVAEMAGRALYEQKLKAFGYGNKAPDGPISSFWLGPAQGGRLGLSTQDQAAFLHRLHAGRLPVKPENAAFVAQLMVDEIRGEATMSGKAGACASNADASRQVAWWAGRLKDSRHDWVFAASIDQDAANALPGEEIKVRVKNAFAAAGLWPAQ